jgi:hypothetical protein
MRWLSDFAIGDKETAEILTFCEIAKHNGSVLTLGDLLEATTMSASEEDLEAAWRMNPMLSSMYTLESGWILERGRSASNPAYSTEIERQKEERSRRNLWLGRGFAALCEGREVKMLAVTGGNSYGRAGARDDIDIFCITTADSLWLFMLKALLLARLFRARRKGSPPICLSYILDERRASANFRTARDALFARDALMARVLHGMTFYDSLLRDSPWMGRYFPRLYKSRLQDAQARDEGPDRKAGGRAGRRVLNSFLCRTIGGYIRFKAYLMNRRFRGSEDTSSALFHADVEEDRCIYESNRYRTLRRVYDGLEEADGAARPQGKA